jgi:hypothetical protein
MKVLGKISRVIQILLRGANREVIFEAEKFQQITGTADAVASSTITGTGTAFLTDLADNDIIYFVGESDFGPHKVLSRTNDTEIIIDSAVTVTGATITKVVAATSANTIVSVPDVNTIDEAVLKDTAQTITNKGIDADQNTITNIEDADIKVGADIDATKLGTGAVDNADFNKLDTRGTDAADELATTDAAQTFTNKSIDADSNTITNIENADIKAGAAIDATKIADGSIDNAEFQRLDGVTSNIQTQLDAKLDDFTSTSDNRLVRTDGVLGEAIQETGITVDDLNNVTGVNDLTVTGDLTVNGTTTTINTATVDVEDANITINKGGAQATADTSVAGLTVEMSDATDARLGYDSNLASKFKAGESGSEEEVITAGHTQTFTNKTVDGNNNTLQVRRDTAANLIGVTLAAGEIGLETDTGKFKIGDGITLYENLSYVGGVFSVDDTGDSSVIKPDYDSTEADIGDDFLFGSPVSTGVGIDPLDFNTENNRMYFDKSLGAFRAGRSGTQWDAGTGKRGSRSAAFGTSNEASGGDSFAFGNGVIASGTGSTAWGQYSQSTGSYSTAFGHSTTASGLHSTAFGEDTVASENNATVFGRLNTVDGRECTAFGNNNFAGRSKATGYLSIDNNSNIINDTFRIDGSSIIEGLDWFVGADATESAKNLRDVINGGSYSVTAYILSATPHRVYVMADAQGAAGNSVTLEYVDSFVDGGGSVSGAVLTGGGTIQFSSTAFGQTNSTVGSYSTAFGINNVASSSGSTVFGTNNFANGNYATAWGDNNFALNNNSTVFGSSNKASGGLDTVWGRYNDSSAVRSTVFGSGMTLTSAASNSVGIGLGDNVADTFTVTTPDIMSIMGGSVGINTVTPSATLTVGDMTGAWDTDTKVLDVTGGRAEMELDKSFVVRIEGSQGSDAPYYDVYFQDSQYSNRRIEDYLSLGPTGGSAHRELKSVVGESNTASARCRIGQTAWDNGAGSIVSQIDMYASSTSSSSTGYGGRFHILGNATSGSVTLNTLNEGTNDANPTTPINITTGNKTAGTGNSGDIILTTGTSVGGSQGTIKMIKSGDTVTAGHVWTASAADGSGYWSAPAASGGWTTVLLSSSQTAVADEEYITDGTAGITLTCPAPALGLRFRVLDGANDWATDNVTIAPNGAEKIDFVAANFVLDVDGAWVELVSDGTDWFVYRG